MAPIFLYKEKPKISAKKKTETLNNKEFALEAAEIAVERHCNNVVLLDLNGKSPATDYFLIATGSSDRQIRTVADEISKMAKQANWQRFGQAGYEQAKWVLLDFVNVVIHLFDEEYRQYYDLEMLWGDAEKIKTTGIRHKAKGKSGIKPSSRLEG